MKNKIINIGNIIESLIENNNNKKIDSKTPKQKI